jgi:fluoroacetyl-CoA thioesterase
VKLIPEGVRATFELTVTDAMTVDFEQAEPELGKLHPVYATYWLTKHMELVSRKIILPFLEPGEAGIGFEVAVKHTASALPGMTVRLEATFTKQEKNRIYARVRAWNELGDLVGEGTTTQVIVPQVRLEAGFAALRERWRAHRQRTAP